MLKKVIVNSQLKVGYVIENSVVGQTIIKLNVNINVKVKHKARIIQNMYRGAFVNSWVPNLANLSETITLCNFFPTDGSIKKTMALDLIIHIMFTYIVQECWFNSLYMNTSFLI